MNSSDEIPKITERIIHKYTQVEKKKRSYSCDVLLTRCEIHTVVAIGDNPGINVTTLGKLQGITKGAASQMVYKLVDKGLIEKRVSKNSDTEVSLTLTDKGKTAYKSHEEYHKTANQGTLKLLEDLPQETEEKIIELLKMFEKGLDEQLK